MKQGAVLGESSVHIVTSFEQAVSMAFRLSRFGFQKVIADISARYIDVAAYPLQQTGPQQEVLADLIVRDLDSLQCAHAVDFRESHHGQQSAEPRHQGKQTACAGFRTLRWHASIMRDDSPQNVLLNSRAKTNRK